MGEWSLASVISGQILRIPDCSRWWVLPILVLTCRSPRQTTRRPQTAPSCFPSLFPRVHRLTSRRWSSSQCPRYSSFRPSSTPLVRLLLLRTRRSRPLPPSASRARQAQRPPIERSSSAEEAAVGVFRRVPRFVSDTLGLTKFALLDALFEDRKKKRLKSTVWGKLTRSITALKWQNALIKSYIKPWKPWKRIQTNWKKDLAPMETSWAYNFLFQVIPINDHLQVNTWTKRSIWSFSLKSCNYFNPYRQLAVEVHLTGL